LTAQLLLDTHIVLWWIYEPKKLSRDQTRMLDNVVRNGECVGLSAMTLLEIATMNEAKQRLTFRLDDAFQVLDTNPAFQIFPITTEIAREVAAMGDALRDPGDRVIVATARVLRLKLVTSDERIIASRLVPIIE